MSLRRPGRRPVNTEPTEHVVMEPTPFQGLENLYYELKPALILYLAFHVSKTPAAQLGIGKLSLLLLIASGLLIIYTRLEYRGYLKR